VENIVVASRWHPEKDRRHPEKDRHQKKMAIGGRACYQSLGNGGG
jgi:hypothetical protein